MYLNVPNPVHPCVFVPFVDKPRPHGGKAITIASIHSRLLEAVPVPTLLTFDAQLLSLTPLSPPALIDFVHTPHGVVAAAKPTPSIPEDPMLFLRRPHCPTSVSRLGADLQARHILHGLRSRDP